MLKLELSTTGHDNHDPLLGNYALLLLAVTAVAVADVTNRAEEWRKAEALNYLQSPTIHELHEIIGCGLPAKVDRLLCASCSRKTKVFAGFTDLQAGETWQR
ncbi:MAG: hypothetical protein KF832_24215 [Caldilineaceae bacterium]|nr:hypothetical protein [Caldilineaceae bacterium]